MPKQGSRPIPKLPMKQRLSLATKLQQFSPGVGTNAGQLKVPETVTSEQLSVDPRNP